MELLQVSGISKSNERGMILNHLSLQQKQGDKLAICGETGSGKSTFLKIIAGFIQADSGTVLLNGQRMKGPEEQLLPGHPDIAYLSQQYELRNHYRVEELLEMASRIPDEEANLIYRLCRISHLTKRRTNELSGGEKQRIALARLLVTRPKLLLLDEPYSNLDLIHKGILKTVISDISEQLHITCILASHDPLDLLSWADEIMVLKDGTIQQQGAPEQLYKQPANEYVAGLFGKYNLIPKALAQHIVAYALAPDQQLLIRPESFSIVTEPQEDALTGVVTGIHFMGAYQELIVEVNEHAILIYALQQSFTAGDKIQLRPLPEGFIFI